MRIAHVVTLLSADGSYGGPTRVLHEQVNALAARGHEVTVFAGWDGRAEPKLAQGVKRRLFRAYQAVPKAGFAGLAAPKLTAELARTASRFDVVHVHLARDLITMPAAVLAARRSRLVVQPHGMIQPDSRLKSRVMDGLVTRRALTGAGAVLFLTPVEEAGLRQVASPLRLSHLANGIATVAGCPVGARSGPVLFCARLHPRKRVLAFVEMAKILTARGVQAQFVIAGPDGGDLSRLQGTLDGLRGAVDIAYIGPAAPDQVPGLLSSAQAFVLPSVNEPFPMTVLESLAVGTPAVLTDTCAIASDLAARKAAVVTDGSPDQLADAVQSILQSPSIGRDQAEAGRKAIRDQYSIAAVVDELESIYGRLIQDEHLV